MDKTLEKQLKQQIVGEVRFDPITRRAYSVDASIFEVEPLCVVIPKNKQDIITTITIAREHQLSIIPRGAATGINGGCLGTGIIIDLSKYLNKIISIDEEQECVLVQPGVVQDQLNAALSPRGYRLGPDTSTGNRATLGGMVANNSAGAHSLRFGRMVDHVLALELITASSETLYLQPITEVEWQKKALQSNLEGNIYSEIDLIRREFGDEIRRRFPQIPRHVSGYNLDELIKPGDFNLCKLITGSEGTLGIATEIKLQICKKLNKTGICVVHFSNMIEGLHSTTKMLAFRPIALEMIDNKIIATGRQSPLLHSKLDWLIGDPQALFIAEFEGTTEEEVILQLKAFEMVMKEQKIGYAHVRLVDPEKINAVWEVRKAGLGLLLSKRTYSRAIAFIEDIAVAPEQLAPFMERFLASLKENGKEAGVYGHVGPGCMHIRPFIDLRKADEIQLMKKIMIDTTDLLVEFGGSLSGEHGDGMIRSWLNQKLFGDKLYHAFEKLKKAFDPENRMNPGKIVHAPLHTENFRLTPETKMASIDTFLDFSREGGFALSVDLCNGNGQCRKLETVMCPSFQATRDEYDTTRARAQALRSVINGRVPIDQFTSKAVADVLDLCLECKGCKKECPSHVDMAKMKAEFLYQYQEKHGYPFRNILFGHIGMINRLNAPISPLVNWFQESALGKTLLDWLGIAKERPLPLLAPERFSSWLKRQKKSQATQNKQVVLFNDTYTEFNHPEIGQATVKILSALGYEVIVPPWHCCGRPLISKGLLRQAQAKAALLVDLLHRYASEGIPIVGIEPSCILTIKEDFCDLLGKGKSDLIQKAVQIAKRCTTLDEFLEAHLKEGKLPLSFIPQDTIVKFHGHCHQKSLVGTKSSLNVLKSIPGYHVTEIDSGCCGLAGSFGYEKEHYDISMKIGELHLLPAVRSASKDTLIVANGFSCRSQIAHGAQRQAYHLAEAISQRLAKS